jgi:hypothetical protein
MHIVAASAALPLSLRNDNPRSHCARPQSTAPAKRQPMSAGSDPAQW